MFASIRGKVLLMSEGYVVVESEGMGYKIYTTSFTAGKIASISEVFLHLYTYVREDTLALYGFMEESELQMFELLISISGIGPKAALGILSIADPKTIRTAILNEDPSILTRVSGVGKKTAERVILELKNKIADLPEAEKERAVGDSDVIEALAAMGYTTQESREAIKEIPEDIVDTGEKVKFALKNIGK